MTNTEMHTYDFMVESDIATADELNLVKTLLPGTWSEILNSVLFVRTGYRSLAQMIEEEDEEWL